jgi:predicted GH43/DUF377 family glycosyl hydrolase
MLPAIVYSQESWMIGPFTKADSVNPCIVPSPTARFSCPVRGSKVAWEAKDVFNPAAVVHDGRIYLLYRAQDSIGKPAGTSRIGLAWSDDGLRFNRRGKPVLYPDNDFMKQYEWEGGCEDPRVVRGPAGDYVLTYTAFNGKLARLAVATSRDLIHWQKRGLAFGQEGSTEYGNIWSKSGSIVSRSVDGTPVAAEIRGRYWMYWGESDIFLATSEDLIHWSPVCDSAGVLVSALTPRQGCFDSRLVEPGPPAVLTESGIVLIYNSSNDREHGDPNLPPGTYAAGEALFSSDDPSKLLQRSGSYFFHPDRAYEMRGQVDNVTFLEGLVQFKGQWFLYYGTADSKIALAVCRIP